MKKQQLIKSIIVLGFFGFLLVGTLSSCEDDAILELENNDECVGSYCRLVLPGPDQAMLEEVKNPDEF